jgi:hypothetical protein
MMPVSLAVNFEMDRAVKLAMRCGLEETHAREVENDIMNRSQIGVVTSASTATATTAKIG